MSFLKNFRKRDTQVDTNTVDDVLLRAILDGESITREKALTLPAVSGAVDFVTGTIASMPIKLYKRKDKQVEEVYKDSRVRLLNGDTGDTLDAFQMKKALIEDYLLGQGGYCYIAKDRNDVVGLHYVKDSFICIYINPDPIYKDYSIFCYDQEYRPWDFIKLLRNTKDGARGVGLTQEVAKALETAYQTLLYQLMLVKSGGNKKGFLKSQRKLGQDEIDILKRAWTNLYGNNDSNVVVLNNGLDFQEASSSSVEMQLNESKQTLRDEINNIFHIYPNDWERTFKEAIYPVVKALETALNRDLLLEKEKDKYFFEVDVKEIVRANLKDRYESYKLAKETGFLTINEIRRMENLNECEGLDVVDMGLGSVLYNVNTQEYYTPNTGDVKGAEATVSETGDGNTDVTEHLKI
jgi:HK97 family phage portal protein